LISKRLIGVLITIAVLGSVLFGLFTYEREISQTEERLRFDNFGISFTYPKSTEIAVKDRPGGEGSPSSANGAVSLVLRSTALGEGYLSFGIAWILPSGPIEQAEVDPLLKFAMAGISDPFFKDDKVSNVDLGNEMSIDFQGRPGLIRDNVSFVRNGDPVNGFIAVWYDSESGRFFLVNSLYLEKGEPFSKEIWDSLKMTT